MIPTATKMIPAMIIAAAKKKVTERSLLPEPRAVAVEERNGKRMVKAPAVFDMAIRLGVPLGQNYHSSARLALALPARRKQTRPGRIVFH